MPLGFFSLALMQLSPLSLQNFPLEGSLLIGPYLFVYSRDLSLFGYRNSDIFRVMALNLALLPVNLSGVFQSLKQIIFGKHTFFFRTPKISGLTPVPLIYSISIFSMLLFEVNCVVQNKGIYDGMMAMLLGYGLFSLLNFKQMFLGHVPKIPYLRAGRQSHSEL
jgi:hypothetical protein